GLLRQSDDRAHALEHEARLRVTAEDALRARSEELISENEALSRLHALADHCASPNTSLRECLEEILATALWLTGGEKGNVQLYDKASNSLRLVTHSGFSTRFLEFFASVDQGDAAACGAAFAAGQRVVAEDITASPIFMGRPSLDVLLE